MRKSIINFNKLLNLLQLLVYIVIFTLFFIVYLQIFKFSHKIHTFSKMPYNILNQYYQQIIIIFENQSHYCLTSGCPMQVSKPNSFNN